MVTEHDGDGHPPIGGFQVRTEAMGDGRHIHYYEWPDEPAADAPAADLPGTDDRPVAETRGTADDAAGRSFPGDEVDDE